ncbi:unnamed protein product [Prunus armeniaca]
MEQIVHFNAYFKQKLDATGKLGFSPQVKMTATMRMLAYGTAADFNDDYLKIAETTSFEACKRFCHAVNNLYETEYLHKPKRADLQKLIQKAEERGFPDMLGSLDCMHWEWKNCLMSHHGAYTGHHGRPTIILEAVASYDTWIWHANFRMPGGRQHQLFFRMKEAYHKDAEKAFGNFQAHFADVPRPARQWYGEDILEVLKTCIILHNMIIEDERDQDGITPAKDTPYHVEEALVPHERGSRNIQLESIN